MSKIVTSSAAMLVLSACLSGGALAAPVQNPWAGLAHTVFEHLVPAERNFPGPVVMSLAQDGDGFLWFGSQSGLGRWDGYRMRNFFFDPKDPGSLPGDFIQAMHVDHQGRLWVGTSNNGLAMYDKQTERFIRFAAGPQGLSSPTINAIASDDHGGIWIGTAAGLDYLDTQHGNVISHFSRPAADAGAARNNQIRALLLDPSGKLWIGSNGGLARRDLANGRTEDLVIAGVAAGGDAVLALAGNAAGDVAFGTLRSGVGIVTGRDGARILALDQVKDANSAMVLSLTETSPGLWWAATYGGGIIEFDRSGHGRRIQHRPAIRVSLAHDRVASLLRDRSGLIWVANERGVNVHNPANRSVETILDGVGLQEVAASTFMTDSAQRVWVALGDQGIDLIGPDGTRSAGLRPDPAQPDTALPNRMILALTEAEPQEAWIGTLLGLYHTSQQGKAVRRVPLPQADALPRIGSIVRDGQALWLGTASGLLRFEPGTRRLQAFPAGAAATGALSDPRITTMLADPDGALWVGTRNGLNRFDPATGRAEQILAAPDSSTGLPHGFVNCLAFDGRGRLWVATQGGGIGVLEGRTADGARRFRRIDASTGLSGNVVNSMRVSGKYMWIASLQGIAAIDLDNLQVHALDQADGLVFLGHYAGPAGVTPQNDILFGSTFGYEVVHPSLPAPWRYMPPLVVSSVRLDARALPAAPLLTPGGPGLSVPAGTRKLELELAALDYSASQRNRYGYWLEGYEKDWTDTDASRRIITYANVPPGHYRLHLRGSNREGEWSPQELVMDLHFLPAWYQTWWARLGGGLSVLALGWGLYRWRVRQLRHTQVMLQQQVYARTMHLERVNAIVKSINDELEFDALLHTILRESSAIGELSAAYALISDAGGDTLAVRASWRRGAAQPRQRMPLAEAQASLVQNAEVVAPGIYLSHRGRMLTVHIGVDQQVQGFLVFEQETPFAPGDLELFKALKEPLVSAFQKANAISAIQQARTDAEASARAKSDFLANISHEIRTPMNAILGFADLGSHLELPPKPRDYFSKIGRAGQNLLSIIDDVLDFSKIESGKLQLEAVPFELDDLLGQIADLFAWRAAEKGLELLVWAAADVPNQLVGDPLRLSQVLVNLVGNALKFTPRGHVALRVSLDGPRPAPGQLGALRFDVEDSGVGISTAQQARLFHAFSQADTSTTRLYGGTGLGLAISQQLVQAMGGLIEIDSVPGQGSRFHFGLQLRCQASLAEPVQAPADLQGRRILVVDDCAATRAMLLQQLSSFGFAPHAVDGGAAALALLQHEPMDLLLLDDDMPVMDGMETIQALQQAGLMPLPLVLMVTEFGREPVLPVAERAGVRALLSKPVASAQLLASVLTGLGREEARLSALAPAASQRSDAARRIHGARVLVVDDNVINQQVAREVLMRAGVVVELADNGADAVQMVDLGRFDAVLMDIQMPGMDGYEATARIRSRPQHAQLPVIAMTAHAVAGFRESSMAMGMNDYVTKPIEAERLFATLANWIERKNVVAGADSAAADHPVRPPFHVPGVDSEAVLERLGGNTQLLTVLLDKFAQEFEASPQRLLAAIEQGAYEAAALLVHKIRGAAGNLSMRELHHAAGELELQLLSPRFGKLDASLAAFAAALETVLDGVRSLDGVAG